ncbi:ACP phosphodiesterase [Uliginosibacterium gangwonense]|uniref:acyl carrier protein phosphodiesterase n=1 Tax=Uliginosibacterium gangwonense TaxID=392736 RepID=UPI00037B5D52|nr:ACP phosphodiesterase [Uliginosibacterium gangwonense]
MNWLAHLYLSEPTVAFRLGNLMPDLLAQPRWQDLPEAVQRGARCHQMIDAYTDAHAVVRRSIARIEPPLRRYGGILVDVFYDHLFLSRWSDYANQPFPAFENEIYHAIDHAEPMIPADAASRLMRMRQHRWLGEYASLEGIEQTLHRIGARLRKPQALGAGVILLEREYAEFAADFAEFFPQLISRVSSEYALPLTRGTLPPACASQASGHA